MGRGLSSASLKLYCVCWCSRSKHLQKELCSKSCLAFSIPSAFLSLLNLFWHNYLIIHLELSKTHHVSKPLSILNIVSYCLFWRVFSAFVVLLMASTFLLLNYGLWIFGFVGYIYWEIFSLIQPPSENLSHEICKKEIGDSLSCGSESSHPATTILPSSMPWATKKESSFRWFLLFF